MLGTSRELVVYLILLYEEILKNSWDINLVYCYDCKIKCALVVWCLMPCMHKTTKSRYLGWNKLGFNLSVRFICAIIIWRELVRAMTENARRAFPVKVATNHATSGVWRQMVKSAGAKMILACNTRSIAQWKKVCGGFFSFFAVAYKGSLRV